VLQAIQLFLKARGLYRDASDWDGDALQQRLAYCIQVHTLLAHTVLPYLERFTQKTACDSQIPLRCMWSLNKKLTSRTCPRSHVRGRKDANPSISPLIIIFLRVPSNCAVPGYASQAQGTLDGVFHASSSWPSLAFASRAPVKALHLLTEFIVIAALCQLARLDQKLHRMNRHLPWSKFRDADKTCGESNKCDMAVG
jgi:hypothetical protein